MLADKRSFNLATNFAGQWLRLRNLEAVSPNSRLFPDFDDNLRQAFRTETELFLDSVRARGPQRARSDQGRLHVSQRAAGQALRHPECLRQPLPPRDAVTRKPAGRPAAAGQRALGHVVRHPNLAHHSRRVCARQHLRRSAAAAAAERAGARREHRRGQPADARAAGGAPQQRRVRELSPDDRSGRLRAGKLQRRRAMARLRR